MSIMIEVPSLGDKYTCSAMEVTLTVLLSHVLRDTDKWSSEIEPVSHGEELYYVNLPMNNVWRPLL